MNIMKKIGVFITSLFLVLSITVANSFADGHAKTILFSIKGPGSGNAFWAIPAEYFFDTRDCRCGRVDRPSTRQ